MLRAGTYLQERYEILELIGSGGMSDVYKAKCHKLNRYVAIKVLKEEFSSDEGFVSKFKMEAQAAACLSHPNMQTPESGKIYSINEGNYVNFPVGVKKFIKYCQEKDEATNRPYTSRYIGSLVADFHRNMLKGGVFLYPQTSSHPTGKLRLLYECNPMAFIAEQSGGLATDGEQRIMEIKPEALHQRVPLYTGSKKMVQKVQEFLTFFNNI